MLFLHLNLLSPINIFHTYILSGFFIHSAMLFSAKVLYISLSLAFYGRQVNSAPTATYPFNIRHMQLISPSHPTELAPHISKRGLSPLGQKFAAFIKLARAGKTPEKLLMGTQNGSGRRLLPPRTKDEQWKLRADQGKYMPDGTYNVVIQENGRPHGKTVAETVVDPTVDDGHDVLDRLWEIFVKKGA